VAGRPPKTHRPPRCLDPGACGWPTVPAGTSAEPAGGSRHGRSRTGTPRG
jgi:hypothetical protein